MPSRAPLQAEKGVGAKGTIAWAEHLEVWAAYAARYGTRQSAERIAERGGFGHSEVQMLTGHPPRSFEPST
jgi:hypothetical protein